ncbi:hypothetical protein FF1_035866 [Malus domestica]
MTLGLTIIHLQDQAPTALEESVLRSSFFQDQALTALGSTIIHLQDQAPTALEENFLRSSFFQDQAPTAFGSTIIHLQDQAQKPLKICSSLFFKIKPKSPRRSVHHRYSRSSLNSH